MAGRSELFAHALPPVEMARGILRRGEKGVSEQVRCLRRAEREERDLLLTIEAMILGALRQVLGCSRPG